MGEHRHRISREWVVLEAILLLGPAAVVWGSGVFRGHPIPFLVASGLAALLLLVFVIRWIQRWSAVFRAADGLCPQCGYDLRESETRCPECGLAFNDFPEMPE